MDSGGEYDDSELYLPSQYVVLGYAENGDVIVESPYIEKWIGAIRSVLDRRWHATKYWLIPAQMSAILPLRS
ncbi:hypothetical protein PMSM_27885 [Paenibacillus macquariensis subsp. macquariensis]|nr:hypothetical protein PMSM_27885 [Paenibacillus macquariensis subsp. macquariensis]